MRKPDVPSNLRRGRDETTAEREMRIRAILVRVRAEQNVRATARLRERAAGRRLKFEV
jgi:head-tail adaptor